MSIDLLANLEAGGCSAKLSPQQLREVLATLPIVSNENVLVDIVLHDDAGVYQLTNDIALIFTTDFFPPLCSDPYEFGQIAAANALSDVYAMGGKPIMALNLMMFPSNELPLDVYARILEGGLAKVQESGAVLIGGHTINDATPKYGLAVVGVVSPNKLITNSHARVGDVVVLTKALGTGVILAGKKIGVTEDKAFQCAMDSMKRLNKDVCEVMQNYAISAATDITGFGLCGHLHNIASASKVTIKINATSLPYLQQAKELIDMGCIPSAAFRNLQYAESFTSFNADLQYSQKIIAVDAQTSGGIACSLPKEEVALFVEELHKKGVTQACVIGSVIEKKEHSIIL